MAGSIRSLARVVKTQTNAYPVGAWLVRHDAFEEWGAVSTVLFDDSQGLQDGLHTQHSDTV
jgi:hypothetical protein